MAYSAVHFLVLFSIGKKSGAEAKAEKEVAETKKNNIFTIILIPHMLKHEMLFSNGKRKHMRD